MAELKQIVRIAGKDVDGAKPLYHQLARVKGVGVSFSAMVCHLLGLDKNVKTGSLSDADIQRIEKALSNPKEFGAPGWMLNRQRDPETGEDIHRVSSELKFIQENDVKFMRKMRSYKGIRHGLGLPVRGQKTKSNFRKNKGKAMGVVKKKDVKPAAAPAK